jgi:protocatechuate 3,4-dioxygenase beta subunit
MSSRVFVSIVWLVASAIGIAGQAPGRDASRPSTGTATVEGTVAIDDANSRPLRRVVLTLAPAGTGLIVSRSTTTDDQGHFRFAGLPAGNYTALRGTKPGFVPTAYGQKRPGGPGVPITLEEGQHLTVAMKMLRGAVITGTITDPQGRPAAQVSVQASAVRIVNGERIPAGPQIFGNTATDDRGVYRIFGLAPGDYVVLATMPRPNNEDIHELSPEEVRWAQQQLQSTGIGAPNATAPSAQSPPPRAGAAVTYAPLYFPGTADPSAATAVTLTAGEERSGIDLPAQFVRTARVQGTVVDPNGQPAQNVQLTVVPKFSPLVMNPGAMFGFVFNRPTVTNGKFSLNALPPGEYTLSARTTPGAPGSGASASASNLWAATDISVTGEDQSDVVLRLEPGMTISGRLKYEGAALQPPADLSKVTLRMTGAPVATGLSVSINPATAQVSADGSFTFSGVTPGRYLINASSPSAIVVPGASWQPKTAIVNGVDAIDTPFDVKPGQNVSNVLLTFTDVMAEVSGTLTDASGKPTSEFAVILFSTDKSLWVPRSRRLKPIVRTGADGKFKFTGVAPGEYFIAALSDFEPNDVNNPVFLDQISASAIKVAVAEGEKKTQDLKLAGQ